MTWFVKTWSLNICVSNRDEILQKRPIISIYVCPIPQYMSHHVFIWLTYRWHGLWIRVSNPSIYVPSYMSHIMVPSISPSIYDPSIYVPSRLHKTSHLYMSHITHVWVMSRMNPSCNVKINHPHAPIAITAPPLFMREPWHVFTDFVRYVYE